MCGGGGGGGGGGERDDGRHEVVSLEYVIKRFFQNTEGMKIVVRVLVYEIMCNT